LHGVARPSNDVSGGGIWSCLGLCHWCCRWVYLRTVIPGTATVAEAGKDDRDGYCEGDHDVESSLMGFKEVFGQTLVDHGKLSLAELEAVGDVNPSRVPCTVAFHVGLVRPEAGAGISRVSLPVVSILGA